MPGVREDGNSFHKSTMGEGSADGLGPSLQDGFPSASTSISHHPEDTLGQDPLGPPTLGRSDSAFVPVASEQLRTLNDWEVNLDNQRFSTDELWPSVVGELQELEEDDNSQLPDRVGTSILDQLPSIQSSLNDGTLSREIHILGIGVVGKFIAHGLANLSPPPPITILMQRPLMMQQWHDEGAAITLIRKGQRHDASGFNIESASNFHRERPNQRFAGFGKDLEHTAEPPTTVIHTLIVTTPSKVTVPALMAVRHRLRSFSTVCIIQDGLGVIEDLNSIVFPDSHTRPTYMLGSISPSHRLSSTDKNFTVVQRGDLAINCSKLPLQSVSPATESGPPVIRLDFSWSPTAAYLVGALARAPNFRTSAMGHKSFYKSQLHRAAIEAVIGPMSVLHDCSNTQLLYSHNAKLAIRSLLEEISLIICSLPELRNMAHVERDFSAQKLEAVIRGTLHKTAGAKSNMLQNVIAGRRTDIDYFNGYLLTRAAELGIPCPRNEMVVNMVKAKQTMKRQIRDAHVPFTMD